MEPVDHEDVFDPRVECSACRAEIREREQEAGRLLAADADWATVMEACHGPRRRALADHQRGLEARRATTLR